MTPSKTRHLLLLLIALLSTSAAMGQAYKPAIEFDSLMQLNFYENNGGFMVDNLQVVFPPAGLQKGSFVITRAGGGAVSTVPLRLDQPTLNNFTAFGMFRPEAVGTAELGQPGDYIMSVVINGQPVTSLPFTLKKESSTDPFNPKTTFIREGPWRDLGFVSVRSGDAESHLEFCWWTSLRELTAGTNRPMVTLHLMLGAQEVAATRSPVVITQSDWQYFHQELVVPVTPVKWMTLPDLTKRDGTYTLIAKANGQPFKSYKLEVKGGQVQRLPRNSLEFEPHTDFISPKVVDTKTSSAYSLREMFWMSRVK
jgi:hypothetical protein